MLRRLFFCAALLAAAAPRLALADSVAVASPFSTAIAPPRPGINVVLSGGLLHAEGVSTATTQDFQMWPSPAVHLVATVPFFGQSLYVAGDDHEVAGSATTRCNGFVQSGARCIQSGAQMGKVARFTTREWTVEERFGVMIPQTHLALGLATFYRATNYGYPDLQAAGAGVELLPNFQSKASFFGHVFYYPNVNNEDPSLASGDGTALRYALTRYELGYEARVGRSRQFVEERLRGETQWHLVGPAGGAKKLGLSIGTGFRF